jgi:hypothetical protein
LYIHRQIKLAMNTHRIKMPPVIRGLADAVSRLLTEKALSSASFKVGSVLGLRVGGSVGVKEGNAEGSGSGICDGFKLGTGLGSQLGRPEGR